jgi:riboflavin biosynthesis pyrimidine reductase
MAKFLYSASVTVDGFIAGPGGDLSWLVDYLAPNPVVNELIPQIGALLVGHRSFAGDDPYKGQPGEGEAFGGGWSGPQFVLAHEPPSEPVPDVTFVDNLADALAMAAAAAGDKYVNVLGANVAAQCLAAGALDEVLLCIAPVMLGDGVRIFDFPGGTEVKLEKLSLTEAPQATNLWLRVIR